MLLTYNLPKVFMTIFQPISVIISFRVFLVNETYNLATTKHTLSLHTQNTLVTLKPFLSYFAPLLWNFLPLHIWSCPPITDFKYLKKCHFLTTNKMCSFICLMLLHSCVSGFFKCVFLSFS